MKKTIYQIKQPNKAFVLTLIIVSLSLTACGGKSNTSTLTKEGLWEKTGYGDIVKLDSTAKIIKAYQYTRETCLEVSSSFDNAPEIETALLAAIDAAKLSSKKNTLVIENGDVSPFKISYKRLKKLPHSCLDNRLITKATPSNVFKHFWNNYNDYYAFFEKRDVDWLSQYAKFQPQVNDNMNDGELFELLSSMINPIKDGHVKLADTQNNTFSPEQSSKVLLEMQTAFSRQNDFDDFNKFGQWVNQQYIATIDNYLDTESITPLTDASGEIIAKSATINQSIGYIQIASMSGFVNGNQSDDIKAIKAFMDRTMTKLRDTQGIIIDVRFNGGGSDSVSVAIASYFTDEKKQVLSKNVRYWLGETETVYTMVEPANDTPYLRPVIVIAHQASASAAESFLMIMKSLTQVTLIGEKSNGIFSDILSKALPNKWIFSLSNEVHYDTEGVNYEGVGVPPDEQVTTFSVSDIKESKDKAIERAMQILGL